MLVAHGLMNPYMSPLHLLFVWNLQWLNDIENDPAYRSWPSGVQELLRATFPGVIRQIRRNFFNLVSPPGHQDYDQEPKKQVHWSLFCFNYTQWSRNLLPNSNIEYMLPFIIKTTRP